MNAADVLANRARWSCEAADAVAWLGSLPDDSIDLLFTSPPYEKARTYGLKKVMPSGQAWVDWMASVVRAAAPKVKGLIAINCDGQTRDYSYSGVPYLLFADLLRGGFNMRRPVVYHRVGIPGSGGPDWLRGDTEPVICVTRPGRLPWSDSTACGHPPKWAPGGEMSHRLVDGQRVNQWGMRVRKDGTLTATDPTADEGLVARATMPSHRVTKVGATDADDGQTLFGDAPAPSMDEIRNRMGELVADGMSQREAARVCGFPMKTTTMTSTADDTVNGATYVPPVLANPGNILSETYTADEVAALLATAGDVIHCSVGGGQMGSPIAHDNEAPFPLTLAEFFVKSFCPPGGVVCDPFAGSGTTAHAAFENGRRFIGCDIRPSQVELVRKRLALVTPDLFAGITETTEGYPMLVLSRKLGETILIGDSIIVTVVDIDRGKCRIGIQAPRDVPILRAELEIPKPEEEKKP